MDNKGYAVSFEKRKVYKSLFLPITVPASLRKAILKAA
jgi:hypothetical protein